jgi:hypothetical protein
MGKQREKPIQRIYLKNLNKMKRLIFIVISLISWKIGFSQENNFIGIWQDVIQDTNSYCLITDKIFYFIYDSYQFDKNDIWQEYYGFIDNRNIDSLSISQFKNNGIYFVLADAELDKNKMYDESYFLIYGTNIHSKYDDFSVIEMEGTKFFMYVRINKFNNRLETNLKEKSPEVFAEYLKSTSQIEILSKIQVYSEPNRSLKKYLNKGDIVTILEEKSNWLKIEYIADEGKNPIIVWIRKKDVK